MYLSEPIFYIGTVTSCVTGFIVIKVFLKLVSRWGLGVFALYRVFVAALIVVFLH